MLAAPRVARLTPGSRRHVVTLCRRVQVMIQMDQNARKVRNQDINPCIEESDDSQKCLNAYNYDKSMCSTYFQRYKNCRKYWHDIMVQRRRDGVKPDMPTAAERLEMLTSLGGKPY
ncbi:coiled-coil-helix-coiled-coil-helix domain-containing protein 7 [Neolamprologus brichardi]|uniref:Coiled-coil-helix-coiled-coil-helix domain-containing protein 7 n=1 Tax=Neolamprologus brichardi TaxID=32507 RepID=A0A3Q4HDM6_NEOBR|nr:coiled-coil-helix-coiled-coil-helix domain-containing protein 7 [Neolamprologus brichardi]